MFPSLRSLPFSEFGRFGITNQTHPKVAGIALKDRVDLISAMFPLEVIVKMMKINIEFHMLLIDGQRAISFRGPMLWNQLELDATQAPFLASFKRRTKNKL